AAAGERVLPAVRGGRAVVAVVLERRPAARAAIAEAARGAEAVALRLREASVRRVGHRAPVLVHVARVAASVRVGSTTTVRVTILSRARMAGSAGPGVVSRAGSAGPGVRGPLAPPVLGRAAEAAAVVGGPAF